MALTPEDLEQIRAVVREVVDPVARDVQQIGGELDDFREEVASAFIEIRREVDDVRDQVARFGRRLDRVTRPRHNGHGPGD